jgi:hypothetical protein
MSRRGRTGPVISLLAFQDIITCVTAIVIVVVLFLTLDLLQRKQGQASESPAALADDLAARIADVEAELAKLRQELDRADDVVKQVASTFPAELKVEIVRRERAIEDLRREQQRQEERRTRLVTQQQAAAAEKFDLEPLRRRLEQTVQETRELQGQLDQEKDENRVLFTLPRGSNKDGWIAVVESGRITVAPLGRASKPQVFVSTGTIFKKSAADALIDWIDRDRLRSAYFLVLIRPAGARTFSELEEALQGKSISFGFDLIDAERTVLHPERGAAP